MLNKDALKDIILGKNSEAAALLEKSDVPDSLEETVDVYYAIAEKLGIETTKDEVSEVFNALAEEYKLKTEKAAQEMEKLDAEALDNVSGGDQDSSLWEEDENGHDNWCVATWHCYTAMIHTDSDSEWVSCWSNYKCKIFNK